MLGKKEKHPFRILLGEAIAALRLMAAVAQEVAITGTISTPQVMAFITTTIRRQNPT